MSTVTLSSKSKKIINLFNGRRLADVVVTLAWDGFKLLDSPLNDDITDDLNAQIFSSADRSGKVKTKNGIVNWSLN